MKNTEIQKKILTDLEQRERERDGEKGGKTANADRI